jgi:predicted DNA-binding transcriptional regulator AlpA
MATANVKTSVNQFDELSHAQVMTGLSLVNSSKGELSSDDFKAIKEYLLQHYGPVLRHKEMIKVLSMSNSKSYEVIKQDETFPKGVPLYDGVNSPKIYWTHEVIAWLEARYQKFRNQKEGI